MGTGCPSRTEPAGGGGRPRASLIGTKASWENLFESILLPGEAIADPYAPWKVDTADGRAVTGLLVAETETSLTRRHANGKDHAFALKDLDGPKQKGLVSLMPGNLAAARTEDELVDLVEYLLTLKTASLTPKAWHILGPFPNDGADAALDTDLAIEKAAAIAPAGTPTGKAGHRPDPNGDDGPAQVRGRCRSPGRSGPLPRGPESGRSPGCGRP